MVSQALDPRAPIKWESSHLQNNTFKPRAIHKSLSKLSPAEKFDVVIISVPNLQSFQTFCAELEPCVHSSTVIVVECTGFVHLEPFVLLSLPKFKTIPVCSIMNESDVKQCPGSNTFIHRVSGNDHRIYFGSSTEESKASVPLRDSEPFLHFYKALQAMQESLEGSLGLLKSINAREFMTYQWKLALPRIVLNPLSVMFEEAYPANLEKQILVKPLISGLIHELFKIIKKMECKLVKGFENETNILKNWLAIYPAGQKNVQPVHADSNLTFYNFYHQQDIDVDLLLLQPILLGDDHGVKTPYLENLYSMLCQLAKINSSRDSIFFTRKFGSDTQDSKDLSRATQDLSKLNLEKDALDRDFSSLKNALKVTEQELAEKRQKYDHLRVTLQDQESRHDSKMKELMYLEQEKEHTLASLDAQIAEKLSKLNALPEPATQTRSRSQESDPAVKRNQPHMDSLPASTPDLTAVAMYGAQLDDERSQGSMHNVTRNSNGLQEVDNGNGMQTSTSEEFHDASMSQTSANHLNNESDYYTNGHNLNGHMPNGYAPNGPMNGPVNGPLNGPMNNGPMGNDPNRKYRQYSSSNGNGYGNQFEPSYDQRNDMNGLFGPGNQRNMNMYPQAGSMPQNQSRNSSFNNQYQQGMGVPPVQYRPSNIPLQPMQGNGPYYSGNTPGQNYLQKKQGRRSTLADQSLNIDMGGRGGMPMPGSGAKQRPPIGTSHSLGPSMNQRKQNLGPSVLNGPVGPDNQAPVRYNNSYGPGGYK